MLIIMDRKPKPLIALGAAVTVHTIKEAAKAGHISLDMFKAIKDFDVGEVSDSRLGCVKYYQIQSNQDIPQRVQVPIWIDRSSADELDHTWLAPIRDGMNVLNAAAPGLHLHNVSDISAAKIFIHGNNHDGCWARYNIVRHKLVEISLDRYWPEEQKNGAATHEIMHALGFQHEHKRDDGETYLKYDISDLDDKLKHNYAVSKFVTGLNRFDPHSIMLYPLTEVLQAKPDGDTVWKTKTGTESFQGLSELDKVGLNILYRPVPHDAYRPSLSPITGLMYCGRHNFVKAEKDVINSALTDGICGPNKGANCAACRVVKTKKSKEIKKGKKWQGWTGLVYCGIEFGPVVNGHDGYCGPNNGPPCEECGRLLIPGYDTSDWVNWYSGAGMAVN